MSKPAPTLGHQIDELLRPFADDEAKLNIRLDDLRAQQQRLETEIADTRQDLQVIGSAKVEALRNAAESDPLLAAAFLGRPIESSSGDTDVADAPALEIVGDAEAGSAEARDGHPLLSPTG
ncbi:MAG: hypothetical protein AAF800_04845 [Planctomycetota bacterium]